MKRLAKLRAADQEQERPRSDLDKCTEDLRIRGVAHFDADDDFSYEFPLRDLYLPWTAPAAGHEVRFGLFIGWELDSEITRAFLETTATEPRVVTMTFVDMIHQAGGYSCDPQRFLVAPVRLRSDAAQRMKGIVSRYWLSNLQRRNAAEVPAQRDYVELIGRSGLTGEEALARSESFMEACYPLDASRTNLEVLTVDPDRHERLMELFRKSGTLSSRHCLFLISDNSD